MGKVPSKLGFEQPTHGTGGTSTAKNKTNVGFKQNPAVGAKGGTSAKKNAAKVGFTQPSHGKGGTSSAKNKGTVGFDQPSRGGKGPGMPGYSAQAVAPKAGDKPGKAGQKVAPKAGAKFKSIDSLMSYRKKKYGA